MKEQKEKWLRFRKKPITVYACQWHGTNHREMYNFLTGKDGVEESYGYHFYIAHKKVKGGLVIKTSEGDMIANIGDWIIKEPFDKDRMYYPCKPDIFELTYEERL